MSKRDKLSAEEIDRVIEKIRKRYNDYIIQYLKPLSVVGGFEDRLISALKANVNMYTFLGAEITVIEELISREDKKQNQIEIKKKSKKKAINFADKIMMENRKLIDGYPEVEPHKDASVEIKKLFGGLGYFEKDYWPVLDIALRKIEPSFFSGSRHNLEIRISEICREGFDKIPPRLVRYKTLLLRFPRDYKAIAAEEKKCILDSAFLLHDILIEFDRVKDIDFSAEGDQKLKKAKVYIEKMISDFRLKDLKLRK